MSNVYVHPAVGEVVMSQTRRAKRISLSVRPNGTVRLSFPTRVSQKRALEFLEQKLSWVEEGRARMAAKYPELVAQKPMSEQEKAEARRAVEAMRAKAKEVLPEMVRRLAAEHGFRHGAVRVKHTKSRWGSCTARGDINLSLSLVGLPEHLAEYIVLHELCHTVHRNHSERFHELLDKVTGGRDSALARELRAYRPGS